MSTDKLLSVDPSTLTHDEWVNLSQKLEFKTNLFIDGSYAESRSGERFDSVNPATGKVIASMALGDESDIDVAGLTLSKRSPLRDSA